MKHSLTHTFRAVTRITQVDSGFAITHGREWFDRVPDANNGVA